MNETSTILTHPLECLANYAINNSICYHGYSVYALNHLIFSSLKPPFSLIWSFASSFLITYLLYQYLFLSCFLTVFPKGAGVFYLKGSHTQSFRILSTSEEVRFWPCSSEPHYKIWLFGTCTIQLVQLLLVCLLWSTATCSSPVCASQLVLCGSAWGPFFLYHFTSPGKLFLRVST